VAPSVDLDDRRTEIAHLAAELATARARVREVERELAACKKEHPPRYPICSWASTPVRGVVLGVDDETGVLLLSAGSKDGVRRGDRFVVHRGDTFLAIIQAELVFEDKWSATVSRVGGRPQSEGPIRAGDRFQQLD
jgi:hypothetical protein